MVMNLFSSKTCHQSSKADDDDASTGCSDDLSDGSGSQSRERASRDSVQISNTRIVTHEDRFGSEDEMV